MKKLVDSSLNSQNQNQARTANQKNNRFEGGEKEEGWDDQSSSSFEYGGGDNKSKRSNSPQRVSKSPPK